MQQQQLNVQQAFNLLRQELARTQLRIMRVRQAVAALQAESLLRQQGRSPRFGVEFASQFGEDYVAWRLLGQKCEGFFIEVGAFDGYHYSVSYGLEALGWNGLLIEALPDAAERCRARRPNSRVVQAALSHPGAASPAQFHVLKDHYGGMLSYLKPTEPHVSQTNWAPRTQIEVPVTTLNELLKDHQGPIDLAMIDVEGNELDVLAGFDLDRFKPRVLIVEDNSEGRDGSHAAYLAKFPYQLASRCSVSAVFVRKDDPEVLERVKWMQME